MDDHIFDHYYDYEELTEELHRLAGANPELATLYSIGESHRGREIWLMEITAPNAPGPEKPGYYIDGNTHPEELTGSMVALYTCRHLLETYGRDAETTRLLDNGVFYILPRVNPDGTEICLKEVFYEWMGNGRYLPGEEQEGPGLHYRDVDGDGRILQMRIPDPKGEWKISGRDPRVMVQREPHEFGGEYYRVLPEGIIEGFEGTADVPIPRPKDGNMNRNYPYGWGPEAEQYGGGNYPMEEPEIAAIVQFLLDHPNICAAVNYHTNAGLVLPPLELGGEAIPRADLDLFKSLAAMAQDTLGYPTLENSGDFNTPGAKARMGTSDDFIYGQLGNVGFTVELWDLFTAAGVEKDWVFPIRAFTEEENLGLLRWNDTVLDSEGFVDWKPFDHPQLGRVEIGGWRRLITFRNPPPGPLLDQICRGGAEFTKRHAAAAPQIEIEKTEVRPLGEDVWEVEVLVGNVGYTPTNVTQRALDLDVAEPVTANLALGGANLVSKETVRIGHLAGRADRRRHYSRFKSWSPSSGIARWRIRRTKEGPVRGKITVRSTKGGTRRVDFEV
ncbi:MAG: M14 family metallopeptidase [Bacillota bacterium]